MNYNYLPIGSVVRLKKGKKKVMITGFYVKTEENGKPYDYVGCLYPEGIISSDNNLVFNNDQIDEIFFLGYTNIEEQEFKTKLYEAIRKDTMDDDENSKTMEIPVDEIKKATKTRKKKNTTVKSKKKTKDDDVEILDFDIPEDEEELEMFDDLDDFVDIDETLDL